MIVWSHTFLHTYEDVCPHQAWRRFIKRDLPYAKPSEAQKHGQDVHKAMERRIAGKGLPAELAEFEKFAKPFDGKSPLGEQKLGITLTGKATGFFAPDVWGRGVIDVLLMHEKTAYLVDWKTGKSKYESPFELEVHAILLHAKFPTLEKIVGRYIYLSEDKVSEMYDLSRTSNTWKRIGQIMRSVEADQAAGHFEKRQGPLCGWCPVIDCEYNRVKR
jgi:hypothetical protein